MIVTRIHFQGSVDEFSRQTICESNLIKLKELTLTKSKVA